MSNPAHTRPIRSLSPIMQNPDKLRKLKAQQAASLADQLKEKHGAALDYLQANKFILLTDVQVTGNTHATSLIDKKVYIGLWRVTASITSYMRT